jgi:hypothetical protein
MNLDLVPDTEQRLRSLAEANGLSVEDYLQQIVEEKAGISNPPIRLSAEEWALQFEEWADSFPLAPPIPDEALSRENLYPDRW